MPLGTGTPKVALAQEPGRQLIALSEFLSSEKNWVYFEFQGDMDETWKKVVAAVPDLTVLFMPAVGERERRVIGRLLIGCRTKITVVTYKRPLIDVESGSGAGRVEVIVISGPESSRTAAHAITRAIDRVAKSADSAAPQRPARTLNPLPPDGGVKKTLPPAPSAHESLIIAMGASTGGTEALAKVFQGLPATLPGIVVVQHLPPVFTQMYARRLNDALPHHVMEAEDNVLIRPGTIHIAPGDRHLMIKKRGSSFYTVIGGTHKVNHHCPSVDILFDSVAVEAGAKAMGVILTGMGADGAKGMLAMRRRGSYTLGQDEDSCVVYGMPMKAFEYGGVVRQAALNDIARLIQAHYPRA